MMVVPGFIHGTVLDSNDPEGLGRCIIAIPGLFEGGTPYWCVPGGWPGGGQLGQGSWYPLPDGAQVIVLFEFGNPDAGAVFFPSMYGRSEDGMIGGPTAMQAVAAAERTKRVVIWDDDIFSIYTTLEGDTEGRVLKILDKESGTSITIDARDGVDHKAHSILVDSQTGVVIKSLGRVDISGAVVTINGRLVGHGGGTL